MNRKQELADAWLKLPRGIKYDNLYNPLEHIPQEFEDRPHLYILFLLQRIEYISFAAEQLLNVKLLPMQCLIIQQMWDHKFPMLIASRGAGKSFILGVYCLLRMLLMPGRRIVIAGSAFRQSKIIFGYMEAIWRSAPILRDIFAGDVLIGPRREPDMYRFHLGESVTLAIPVGDGNTIRGLRANDIIVDEFASITREVFEVVIQGFAAVRSDPFSGVQYEAMKEIAKQHEVEIDDFEVEENKGKENQIVISGTAYYDFNHFAEYFKKYHKIITSKGDLSKISDTMADYEKNDAFDWQNYCVIRIPYDLIPKGFMDDGIILAAKATSHVGLFDMEYGACVHPDTKIITDSGVKRIVDVSIGDLVLTHNGRFRKIKTKTYKKYNGDIVRYKTYGYNKDILVTPNHPFWYDDDVFNTIQDNTHLSNLKELNNKTVLDIENICTKFLETYDGKSIYRQSSQSKFNVMQQRDIRKLSMIEIRKKYDIKDATIYYIKSNRRMPKGLLPKQIKLDYYFGLIIGYYAAEGSGNSRQISFALDEHKDTNFKIQLIDAIYKVFGTKAKVYIKKKNVMEITVNNSLFSDVMKYICPGNSHTKIINHDILFSNPDLIRGVIEGYWNGDGHTNPTTSIVGCVNLNLLTQIRLCLSYFNIAAAVNEYDKKYSLVLNGNNNTNFRNLIYNKSKPKSKNCKIANNDTASVFSIKNLDVEYYDGYVYNLEVEEDNSYSLLNATVHNCFTRDSYGFFKRSLIESCVISANNCIAKSDGIIDFTAKLVGDSNKRYVFGVDVASEADRFAIVILELYNDHRRIVYGWSTNRKEFNQKVKENLIKETDYYGYCARKIRDLMRVFPCERIMMDSQGGGIAVMEALHDKEKIKFEEGEEEIWPIIDPESPSIYDGNRGLHILDMVNFANPEWTSEANHGMKKDFEDKMLLFPFFDSVTLELAAIDDNRKENMYDTFEDCLLEIEELKNELSTIVITQTATGRERWDTPEVKLPGNKKGRLRKDRYSALLMANMGARRLLRNPTQKMVRDDSGGFARSAKSVGKKYVGPEWLVSALQSAYD